MHMKILQERKTDELFFCSSQCLQIFHFSFQFFRSSEMVFLPDMSEGETSDGDAYNEDEQAMNTMNTNNSNFNTLETMSARSFGFIKPSQKAQDNDLVNRIRRHKSFFNAETSGNSSTKTRARVQMHAHGNFHFWT